MKVLAIDTATSCGVVGLSENGKPVAEISVVSKETHSARLLPSIEWLIKTVGWKIEEMDGFGITLGPGSFTGLRVGLSTIKGFAWTLGKPVCGINSLELLAHQVQSETRTIVPMLDARKTRVYGAAFRWKGEQLNTLLPASDIGVEELISNVEGPLICLGEGCRIYKEVIESSGRTDISFASRDYDLPRGATISRLAFESLCEGNTIDLYQTEPTYLRASEAELKRKQVSAAS